MWHLTCFGGLRASRQEQTIERFRTQKTAALLALLALRGSRSREDVCALLWSDASPEAARNSLSAALSALRRELGDDFVRADRQSVALASGSFQTDVDIFDDAFKAGDFARVVELYRGHLLPGFYEDPFPALEREYQEKARSAFYSRLEELEENGQPTQALELARRGASLFGDEERWFLGFMRAHYGLGDLDAALRAYEALGRFMRKNGDTASESARLLAKAIRREKEVGAATPAPVSVVRKSPENISSTQRVPDVGTLAPLPFAPSPIPEKVVEEIAAPRNNLPTQWTRFFGRESERSLLGEWLRKDQKLVTLSGAGGSGKTRLSLETLRDLAPDWEGDIIFVPLAPIEDPELILPAIRDAMALIGTPDLSPLEQIERTLRGRRAILFLDNFEQLVEGGAARLQALRERLPQTTFLVTSRILLQLPGEREFPVTPLPTPLRNTVFSQVRECASAALFCDRSGLVLDEGNAEAVGALCRRLDGIPLALELAAARAKVLSPSQILERLQKHPDFLQSRELGIPARHKTLRATIEWSTDLLPPDLRQFWTRLSLFHGGWTLDAAEKIASIGSCEEWETLDWLTQLRDCSLIFIEERAGGPRFRMLQTLREFGREQLQNSEEVERAYFDFYLGLAQQAASAMQGPGQTTWLARLDAEQDNLRAALTYARDFEPERGLLLATALIDFWETRLSLDEGRSWIETFLRATGPEKTTTRKSAPISTAQPAGGGSSANLDARVRALSGAGRMAWYGGDLKDAEAKLREGLEAARQTGDTSMLANATRSSALGSTAFGDAVQARDLGRESVRLAREAGDDSLLLNALMDLGFAEINVSDFAASEVACLEAISLARREGSERALAMTLATLAIAYNYLHRYDEANSLLAESEALSRRLGAGYELIVALSLGSHIASIQGHHQRARALYHQALSNARDTISDSWTLVNMLLSVAYSFFRRGDARACARIMGSCEALAQSIDYQLMPFMVPEFEHFRAEARRVLGDQQFTHEWQRGRLLSSQQIIDFILAEEVSEPAAAPRLATRSHALSAAGRLAWYDGDFEASGVLVTQALDAARQSGDVSGFVHAVTAFVRLSTVGGDIGGDIAQGRYLAEEAIRLCRTAGDESLLIEALIAHSYATVSVYELRGARPMIDEAIALARKLGDDIQLTIALTSLGTLCYYQQQFAEARLIANESVAIARRLNSPFLLFASLWCASNIAREQADFQGAKDAVLEILEFSRDDSFRWNACNALSTAGYLLIRRGDVTGGVQALSATQTLSEQINYKLVPSLRVDFDKYRTIAREMLGEEAFESVWNTGKSLTLTGAIDFTIACLATKTSQTPDPLIATRARALSGAGRLAWYASDLEKAGSLLQQGLDVAREIGDAEGIVYATRGLMRTTAVRGDGTKARELANDAVTIARASGDTKLLIKSLLDQAFAEINVNQFAVARTLTSEAAALAQEIGDEAALPLALNITAIALSHDNRALEALEPLRQSEAIARRLGSAWDLQIALVNQGYVFSLLGEHARAQETFNEGLTLCHASLSESWTLANNWFGIACIFMRRGEVRDGAQLLGAAEAMRQRIGYEWMPLIHRDHSWATSLAHQTLGETEFAEAMQRGALMTTAEVFDFAVRPISSIKITSPGQSADSTSGETLAARSRALSGAGRLAWHSSDYDASRDLVYQGLETARASGDLPSFVYAVSAFVRFAMVTGDVGGIIPQAQSLSEEAVERSRSAGDKSLLLDSLTSLAYTHTIVSHFKEAHATNEAAISLARELGDELRLLHSLNNQAAVYFYQGLYQSARTIAEESVARSRRLNSTWELIVALWTYSAVARELGELELADQYIIEALQLCRANPTFRWGIVTVFATASYLFIRRGAALSGVRLMGASEAIRQTFGYQTVPVLRPEYECYRSEALVMLGHSAFDKAWAEGRAMTTEAAMELALHRDATTFTQHSSPSATLAARSRALSGAGRLAWQGSDLEKSRSLVHEGLESARQSGDIASFVYAVAAYVRFAMVTGDIEGCIAQSRLLSEEAVARSRREGNKSLLLDSLISLGYSTSIVSQFREAYNANEEAISLARELGDETALVRALNNQASVYFHQGIYTPARVILEESDALCRRLNSTWDLIASQWTRSGVLREQGHLDEADKAISEVLEICRSNPSFRWGVSNVLMTMSYLFVKRNDPRNAACLMSASEAINESLGYHPVPVLLTEYERYKTQVRAMLEEADYAQSWAAGHVLTTETAIELALRR